MSGYELCDPTAVVGLFNPKLGFLISSFVSTDYFEIVDLASDTPKRDVFALPASSFEVDLIEPIDD